MSSSQQLGIENYTVLCKIGEGAAGIVMKGHRKGKPEQIVALKKLRNASDKNGIGIETIREIYMLRELEHENIINILDIFGKGGYLYIIMPFAVGDLEQLIQNKEVLLTPPHIKAFMQMLLKGVQYIHHKFILHRDLKPSNCLILPDNTLKISDFGLSREYGSPNRLLSYQACTIWYRSPELLFGADHYGISLDMWSCGCIFAELLLRVPLFGGNDNSDIGQIGRIFRILGTPNFVGNDDVNSGSNVKKSNVYWKDVEMLPLFRKFEPNQAYPIDNLFKATTKNGKDLFSNLCKYDPNKRLSATQALRHPYFSEEPLATAVEKLPNPKAKSTSPEL